ncbi:MAG: NfeD family protein [Geminicoccaceae bacterium]
MQPIVNGRGRIKLGDGTWAVTGPDLPAGHMVEIVGAEGALLKVIPTD